MFCVSMVGSFALILLAYAVIDKILWLAWIGWFLFMIAVFMEIKVECNRMDKDREFEEKIKELEKEVKDTIFNLEMDNDELANDWNNLVEKIYDTGLEKKIFGDEE